MAHVHVINVSTRQMYVHVILKGSGGCYHLCTSCCTCFPMHFIPALVTMSTEGKLYLLSLHFISLGSRGTHGGARTEAELNEILDSLAEMDEMEVGVILYSIESLDLPVMSSFVLCGWLEIAWCWHNLMLFTPWLSCHSMRRYQLLQCQMYTALKNSAVTVSMTSHMLTVYKLSLFSIVAWFRRIQIAVDME